MFHDDDRAPLMTFGDDDYRDGDDEFDGDLGPESDPVVDKALETLRAAGLEPTHELDADADDDGRAKSWSFFYVKCAHGCGPVAEQLGDSLTDKSECEAPEGEGESNCQRAVKVLTAAGAFADGWA